MPAPPLVKASQPTATGTGPRSDDSRGAALGDLAVLVAAIDRLARIEDTHRLTREAMEFGREVLGLERVSLYLVECTEPQIILRGGWGTSDRGATTDERELAHIVPRDEFESLKSLSQQGELWEYRSLESRGSDRRRLPWTREDRDWLAITPIMVADEVVGIIYNDTAISRAPLDRTKQALLAVFGRLLAGVLRGRLAGHFVDKGHAPVTQTSRFIHKVLAELQREPQLTGERLAERFRVSPGHLARTFKAEVGFSLVEFRNRLRLDRFFAITQAGESTLAEAALQAGFGSYAQFLRVHRQMTGVAPREYSANSAQNDG